MKGWAMIQGWKMITVSLIWSQCKVWHWESYLHNTYFTGFKISYPSLQAAKLTKKQYHVSLLVKQVTRWIRSFPILPSVIKTWVFVFHPSIHPFIFCCLSLLSLTLPPGFISIFNRHTWDWYWSWHLILCNKADKHISQNVEWITEFMNECV